MIKESICSHGRSHAFLTEAIKDLAYRNCTFKAYRWSHSSGYDGKSLHEKCEVDGCTEMGVLAQRDYPMNSGMFYVPTRANPPYCGTVNNCLKKNCFLSSFTTRSCLFQDSTRKLRSCHRMNNQIRRYCQECPENSYPLVTD